MFLTINFKGGLGNQIFQYANGRYLSIFNKIPYLLFNVDNYSNESLDRKFALDHFKIKGSVIKNTSFKNIFKPSTRLNKLVASQKLYNEIEEAGFYYQEQNATPRLFNAISGYWQSEKYFKAIRQQLLAELQPKEKPAYPAWVSTEQTVAVHIRRTDYLAEPRYGFLGINYYRSAMDFIKEYLQETLFIIFSDDLEWCKENIKDTRVIYFDDEAWRKDYLQLHLISKCKHQIIANSSFSWWGAWLNENEDKIVLRPAVPFKDNALLHEFHYPESWIAINN